MELKMAKLDNGGLYIYKDNDFVSYEFKKRVVLCGVPGAFTPGCTHKHLRGFKEKIEELENVGIDKVVFMSVTDPCVMDEWNKIYGHEKIDAVADPLAVFTKQMGFEHDYGKTMGIRCHRFAILIDNGELIKEFKSPYIEGVLGEL